jgi:hypothetical protein
MARGAVVTVAAVAADVETGSALEAGGSVGGAWGCWLVGAAVSAGRADAAHADSSVQHITARACRHINQSLARGIYRCMS